MFQKSPFYRLVLCCMLVLLAPLLVTPAWAQIANEEEDPDDGEILVAREDAEMVKVAEGDGWFQMHVYDKKNPTRGVVTDLLFVTPTGVADLPVPESEKQELLVDFGLIKPEKDDGLGLQPVADLPGLIPQLQKPVPAAAAHAKSSCSTSPGGGPPDDGGIIIIDRNHMQEFHETKALYPDLVNSTNENAKGCFGWNNKTKTRNWSLASNTIGDSFNLGGGFTGSYQVQLPFQTTGNATLKYRVKKFACVPYKFRFSSVRAQGNASLGGNATLSASASLAYSWEKEWQVLNPHIATFSFWVGPIPVWVDVNLPTYVGLGLDAEVSANVNLEADFGANGTFDYTCTSSDCCGDENFQDHFDTSSLTASLEAKIEAEANARLMVRAELYDDSVLYGEAGIKAFVGADIWGYYGNTCGDADGNGQNETVEALVADAEAGFDWVFGIGGALAPDRDWTSTGSRFPLGFWDLLGEGGSTALSPLVSGPSSIEQGQTAAYTVKMRPCYPYSEAVNLDIDPGTWSGNPQIAQPKSAQTFMNSTTLSRAFSQAGFETVTVTATTDAKGRDLAASTSRNLQVTPGAPITPVNGLWYNPARNGNGISLHRNMHNQWVVTWYTYTASGTPIWYQSGVTTIQGNTFNAPLYKITRVGNAPQYTDVGSLGLSFSSTSQATFNWTLNGQSGSEPFQFLIGSSGRGGLWGPPSEPYWGIDVADGGGNMVTTVAFYAGSQPTWVQGSGPRGADVTFNLLRFSSPDLCPSCGGNTFPSNTSAGTIRLQIAGGNSSTGTVSTAINAAGTVWNRTHLPIVIHSAP